MEAGKIELHCESLVVSQVLDECLVIARGLAHQKGQIITPQFEADLPSLSADPVRLKQILFNLLSNAVKFSPKGDTITVIASREDAAHLRLAVQDTGAEIRAEDLPRLFREFMQLETTQARHHEGSGLGLALTKQLVELHGGRIWAESPGEGQGSIFVVVLPLGGSQP